MIKVMHVCSDTNIGGAGRYLLNLLEESDKEAFELVFVLPQRSKLKALLEKSGGKVKEVAIAPDQSFNRHDVPIFMKLIKELQPDIIHTHASLSARIAAKLIGAKGLIYTRHYVDTSCMEETIVKKRSLKERLKRGVNNALCDGVIGVAKECEPVILEMGIKPEKIKIIPNGVVPLKRYSQDEKDRIRERYNIPPKHKVITIMARLSKEKGHEVFIDTIKRVTKERNDVVGVIVGTGPEEVTIAKYIQEESLEDVIKMTGFIEQVEAIHNIATLQMNTSYTEAQSLALSEGMSLGVPAVVTNTGGNPSMIRDGINGYVAPVGDSEALASKVLTLLNDEISYKAMSENAELIYKKHYTAKEMTKNTEAFYKTILEVKNR